MKRAVIFLISKFEEIETVTTIDLLRRANINVTIASLTDSLQVVGSHNIIIMADKMFSEIEDIDFDAVILPGGPGAKNYKKLDTFMKFLIKANENKKLLAAICAAPMVFGMLGFLEGKQACCFPGFENELVGVEVIYDNVVSDQNIITSRGAGTTIAFALKIIEKIMDKNTSVEIGKAILV